MIDSEPYSYPADIAAALRTLWSAGGHAPDILPDETSLVVLIDRIYQASLLKEEGEAVRCRIIVAPPEAFADGAEGEASDLRVVLRFAQPIAFTPHDIRKLAATANSYRTLLAVRVSDTESPVIWGMVSTGTKWMNRFGGDRYDGTPLPPHLVLQIVSPGHLIAASGDDRVLESAGGRLLTEGFDPFRSSWLPQRFRSLRSSLLEELQDSLPDPQASQICDFFVRDVAQSVVRRVLALVRTRGHGGTLVYIPADGESRLLADQWFRFRVRFAEEDAALWFRKLLGRLITRVLHVGHGLGLPVCTWNDYRNMHDPELADLDEALIGFGHFLADLMSVDGALVLDHHFRLIGFGGEILGESPVLCINRACDLEASRRIVEPADSSGTRHRAAYRLVDGTRDSMAIVVSQDGDVRIVAHHGGHLTYWPYLP